MVVYDKARYHTGKLPEGLKESAAYTHAGLFLGWLIERKLVTAELASRVEVEQFLARKLTGPRVYRALGGELTSELLTDEGNAFAKAYFDVRKGKYLEDYGELLADELPSYYHVKDGWKSYDKLRARIDERYVSWRQRQKPAKSLKNPPRAA